MFQHTKFGKNLEKIYKPNKPINYFLVSGRNYFLKYTEISTSLYMYIVCGKKVGHQLFIKEVFIEEKCILRNDHTYISIPTTFANRIM